MNVREVRLVVDDYLFPDERILFIGRRQIVQPPLLAFLAFSLVVSILWGLSYEECYKAPIVVRLVLVLLLLAVFLGTFLKITGGLSELAGERLYVLTRRRILHVVSADRVIEIAERSEVEGLAKVGDVVRLKVDGQTLFLKILET